MNSFLFKAAVRIACGVAGGICLCSSSGAQPEARPSSPPSTNTNAVLAIPELTLEECLERAWQNNRRKPASQFAVTIAEAQHRQALAGYWPQITGKLAHQTMDQAPNFLFPAQTIPVPAQTYTIPAGVSTVTVPAGVLGPTAVTMPVAVPAQTITTPAQDMVVPAQDIKVMDQQSVIGSVGATWLLYDGGMRKGYRIQAKAGLEAARQEVRRTELEIGDTVRRYYYGAVLARQLRQLGEDTLGRMDATLTLTEAMYKEGSGKVKKTDYLENKVMVESLRSMVALLEKNERMTQAALANAIGMAWDASVKPKASEIPYAPLGANLDALVGTAYSFNPDWARLEAGLQAREGEVATARSGHYPKVALTGELHRWWNEYEAGIATRRNKEGWTVGVGMELPLFDGFLTRGKVSEARARLARLKEEKVLLKDGLGLQIRDLFLGLEAAAKAFASTENAMKTAMENRDLNQRAYESDLVETEKVIRAQLMEAVMSAQHYKVRYDHVALQSQLNLVVGTECEKRLNPAK